MSATNDATRLFHLWIDLGSYLGRFNVIAALGAKLSGINGEATQALRFIGIATVTVTAVTELLRTGGSIVTTASRTPSLDKNVATS